MTTHLARTARRTRSATYRGSSVSTQIWVLTGRSLRAWVSNPSLVLLSMVQPVIILFLLTQVFGRIQLTSSFPPGTRYFDFVLPAVLVDNAVQSSMQAGTGLVDDLKNGIVARLRSLPILPSSLLIARSITNPVRSTIQVIIILVLASTVLGYSPNGGMADLVASAGLTVFIGWGLGWAFIAAGAWFRKAEPMQNLAIIMIYPLMFASSAYVPVSDLPPWLAAVARANPLTYAIDATRAIAFDAPSARAVLLAMLISSGIAVVGAFFAVLGFRRPL